MVEPWQAIFLALALASIAAGVFAYILGSRAERRYKEALAKLNRPIGYIESYRGDAQGITFEGVMHKSAHDRVMLPGARIYMKDEL